MDALDSFEELERANIQTIPASLVEKRESYERMRSQLEDIAEPSLEEVSPPRKPSDPDATSTLSSPSSLLFESPGLPLLAVLPLIDHLFVELS